MLNKRFDKIKSILDYNVEDIHYYILLLSAPVLLTLYRYFSYPEHIFNYFPSLLTSPEGIATGYKWHLLGFFILLFIIPAFHVFFFWKKPFDDLGWGLGDKKYGIKFTLFTLLLVVLPVAYFGSSDPSVLSEYPLAKILLTEKKLVWGYHLAYVVFYYVAWEFYFRGYLLFGLKEKYGAIAAILIQTISSCLVHIDKPFAEIFLSIPVGILLGIVALRARSFWYAFLVHAALGVLTDLFIIFK